MITPGVRIKPPPLVLIAVGTFVFLLGCIWPAIMFDDFQNEREASSWPTTSATVVSLDIEIYEYQCGDSENRKTCREYIANYHLQYTINGTIFDVNESEEVSHFESRVWEVDYPVDSTRDIAYNPENPRNIDVDPQHYTPFIGPLVQFIGTSLLTVLLILGGIKGLVTTLDEHEESIKLEKGMLPQSSKEITFSSIKTVWGVRTYQHPTVEALAQKLTLFSCTEQQIDEFFTACQTTGGKGDALEDGIDLGWLNQVNTMAEQHSSIEKFNLVQKANIARVIFLGISLLFLPIALVFALPVWLTYHALPWYGWIPVWGVLTPIGLVFITRQIIRELKTRTDQGLGALLMDFLDK
jgi:hypothetical protein